MSLTALQSSDGYPKIDDDGFLSPSETWSKRIAEVLAQGVVPGELAEDHWKVIDYLRNYYVKFETMPPVKMLCRDTGFKFTYICKLFPTGLAKGACKIAGIPKKQLDHAFFILSQHFKRVLLRNKNKAAFFREK